MAFFSKPSAADPLLADAEAGNHRAPDAPSKKRPALKTVLGGVGLFFALAFGAAAAFDASKSPSVPEQTEFTSKKWHKIQDVARSYKHTIRLKADDRFVLTLDSNDPKNGATIILAKAALKGTRDKSQEWVYNLATKQIQLKANDKFVVNLVDLGNGATINLWEKIDGKENQRWIFKDGKFHAAADEKRQTECESKQAAATPRRTPLPRRRYRSRPSTPAGTCSIWT